jgi:lysophospholipid acyltransferase (LPLAT)-like uncharacterized protein
MAPGEPAALVRGCVSVDAWGGRLVRGWTHTWRVRRSNAHRLEGLLEDGPVVLGFFHEHLTALAPVHADRGFVGMVSQSTDGERLSRLLSQLGYHTVRGSTSKGARAVARQGLRALESGRSLAIAVDGPRGPRRTVAPGAAMLARWSGRPLVLVGCRVWPALRLSSWDRQMIPAPLATVDVAYAVAATHTGHGIARQLTELALSGPIAPSP